MKPLSWIVAMAVLLAALPVHAREAPFAYEVATGLARLGPRPDGGPAPPGHP